MEHLWLICALLAVFGKTAYYTVQKRLLDGERSAFTVGPLTIPERYFDIEVTSLELGYYASFYGFLIVSPLGIYTYLTQTPDVSNDVYAIVFGLGVLELIGLWMYLKALSLCDMSIASPMKKMKPTFVAVLEPMVFAVPFSGILVAAAASTGVGGYVVLMKGRDLLAPFKRLSEPGPALALMTAVIYAVLSLGSRYGVTNLSTFIFGSIIFFTMTIGYRLLLMANGHHITATDHVRAPLLLVGAMGAFRSVMVWAAYGLASATLVVIVTQLTILLDVWVGGKLLKEGNLTQRLVGAAMILAGVIIALAVA